MHHTTAPVLALTDPSKPWQLVHIKSQSPAMQNGTVHSILKTQRRVVPYLKGGWLGILLQYWCTILSIRDTRSHSVQMHGLLPDTALSTTQGPSD